MIYEPAEDSFLVGKWSPQYVQGKKVLDMGCGSGYLSSIAIQNGAASVLAVDTNEEAVDYVEKQGINAQVSDMFATVHESFDVILCNPPYLPQEAQEDEESARITTGGKEGYEWIELFLQKAKQHLNNHGIILLVCSSLTGDIEGLFIKEKYTWKKVDEESYFFERLKLYELRH